MSQHQAAMIAEKGAPLDVKSVSTPSPSSDQVLVRAKVVAINPVDIYVQEAGMFVQSWPTVAGSDVAGEIVEVGSSVKSLKKGTRVLVATTHLATGKYEQAGFQEMVIAPENSVVPIPDSLSFEDAAVLPLSVSTAAAGLYQKEHLGLNLPSLDPKPSGKKLLIWGGSGSVGSSAVQLAAASGYELIVTASQKNHEYVKGLAKAFGGKIKLFDYKSPSIVGDLSAELGDDCVGAYDAIGSEETEMQIGTVLAQLGGGNIASVLPTPEGLPSTVTSTMVFAVDIFTKATDIGDAIFGKFLPEALSKGKYLAAPKPEVVGRGLESLPKAMKVQKDGVSAKKIVVAL